MIKFLLITVNGLVFVSERVLIVTNFADPDFHCCRLKTMKCNVLDGFFGKIQNINSLIEQKLLNCLKAMTKRVFKCI